MSYFPRDNGTAFPTDTVQFQRYARDAGAAANAPYGSIAYRNDPNQYGSIASRQFPGAFGPTGTFNASYQAEQASADAGMQRRKASDDALGYAATQAQMTAGALAPYFSSLSSPSNSGLQWPSFTNNDAQPTAPNQKPPSAPSLAGGGMSRFGSALSSGLRFATDPLGTLARAVF